VPALAPELRARLHRVLERAATQGWLGPAPIDAQIDHSLAVAAAVGDLPPAALGSGVLDLGSGGGLPGLVVALVIAPIPVTLLDGGARRCAFLRSAAGDLQDAANLAVAEGRAEDLARTAGLAGAFGVVTARSFGPPAVTAECATGFLGIGGSLVVTEPPSTDRALNRWDRAGLAGLGMGEPEPGGGEGSRLVVVAKIGSEDPRFPRRAGIPAKRPLW
jgi:16S rRNA (guanine527-N7)-methyltransferase